MAVTGAAGWLGRALCDWLCAKGVRLVRIVRNATKGSAEVSWDIGARRDHDFLAGFLEECGCVIHCAAHVHRLNETEADRRLFEQVNVEGTQQIIAACRQAGVPRFIYVSTIAVYDWELHGAKPESAPLRCVTAYAQSKLEAERFVQDSGLDWRVGRMATVYGQGDKANFMLLARALGKRRFVLPGNGEARKSVIPLSLAAELLGRFGLADSVKGRLLNLAAPAAPKLNEICDAFSTLCGFPPPPRVPVPVLRLLALAGDSVKAVTGCNVPLRTELLRKLRTDTVVDTGALEREFSDVRWPSFLEGLGEASEYYRCAAGE